MSPYKGDNTTDPSTCVFAHAECAVDVEPGDGVRLAGGRWVRTASHTHIILRTARLVRSGLDHYPAGTAEVAAISRGGVAIAAPKNLVRLEVTRAGFVAHGAANSGEIVDVRR